MTARSVEQKKAAIRTLEREVQMTRCAECDHTYSIHVPGLRCFENRCKCKTFADAADMLLSVYTETREGPPE